MFPGSGQLSDPAVDAAFISPRDRTVTAFTSWERGGTALGDNSSGLNVRNWLFTADPATGEVYVGAPDDDIDDALLYTIDPLPVEVAGSFDLDMRYVLAWRDVDGNSFLRWYDTSAYTNLALPALTHSLKLAIDDVRDHAVALGGVDTLLAYIRGNRMYYRLLRDDFDTEYYDGAQADGFSTLYQIGMNTLFRFQFQRSGAAPDESAPLSYKQAANRAGYFAGFDAAGGAAAMYSVQTTGQTGAPGPSTSATKLVVTESGQTIFLRSPDGDWQHLEYEIELQFYEDKVQHRATRTLVFSIDANGAIRRTAGSSSGEAVPRIVEVGEGTASYTATVFLSEAGQGVTFHLVAAATLPTGGQFTPTWATGDFAASETPDGEIAFLNYGAFAVLYPADPAGSYTARSNSTRLRWAAGTLPEALRPVATRVAPCTVSRNGVALAGQAQLNTDGSAEFWPWREDTSLVVLGAFQKSSPETRYTKGFPADWQLVYTKVGVSTLAPTPILSSLSPDPIARFDTGVTLTLTGSGFRASTVVYLNDVEQTTTVNSNTELEIELSDTLLESAGTLTLSAFTPEQLGGFSNELTVDVENPEPVISSLTPDNVDEDLGDLELTVTGTGFVPDSEVFFDGNAVTTEYVDDTELTATVPGALLVDPDDYDVEVVNAAPGGGTSNAETFTVNDVIVDPDFANVVTLLHLDGADASTTITDVIGKTWTAVNNAQIDDAQTHFSTNTLLESAASDYVSTASHADFGYGTGDFTIEFFARPSNVATNERIWWDQRTSGNQVVPTITVLTTGAIRYFTAGAQRIISSAGTIAINTWYHVALCRASGTTRLFVNGTQVGSNYTDGNNYITSPCIFGQAGDSLAGAFGFVGHLNELRVTKGVARYTGTFTPPSAPFPNS